MKCIIHDVSGLKKKTNPKEPWWRSTPFKVTVVGGVLVTVIGGLGQKYGERLLGLDGSGPKPESGQAIRVVAVTHVPKQNDFTWITPNKMDASAVKQLDRKLQAAGAAATVGPKRDTIMRAAGAAEDTMSTVELELMGNRNTPVRIVSMRAVPTCHRPLRGTLFSAGPEGGVDTVRLGFDLDRPLSIGQYARNYREGGDPFFYGDYFADHKYVLARGEEATFRATARTFTSYCEYFYRLGLIVNGHTATQDIYDGGRSFRVSSRACEKYQAVYEETPDNTDPVYQPWVPVSDPRIRHLLACKGTR